jgi:hypothetical protein
VVSAFGFSSHAMKAAEIMTIMSGKEKKVSFSSGFVTHTSSRFLSACF